MNVLQLLFSDQIRLKSDLFPVVFALDLQILLDLLSLFLFDILLPAGRSLDHVAFSLALGADFVYLWLIGMKLEFFLILDLLYCLCHLSPQSLLLRAHLIQSIPPARLFIILPSLHQLNDLRTVFIYLWLMSIGIAWEFLLNFTQLEQSVVDVGSVVQLLLIFGVSDLVLHHLSGFGVDVRGERALGCLFEVMFEHFFCWWPGSASHEPGIEDLALFEHELDSVSFDLLFSGRNSWAWTHILVVMILELRILVVFLVDLVEFLISNFILVSFHG